MSAIDTEEITVQAPAPRTHRAPIKDMDKWRDEERGLITRWKKHSDSAALATLLERYRPLMGAHIRKILAGRKILVGHRADLEQEAAMALIRAIAKFDEDAGAPLCTLATCYVRNALLRYGLDFSYSYRIGTGSDERKAFYAAQAARAERVNNGLSDVLDETDIRGIMEKTGSTEQSTRRAVDSIYATSAGIEVLEEMPGEQDDEEDVTRSASVAQAMDGLKTFVEGLEPRKAKIFALMLEQGDIDHASMALEFGVTPERVGQIRREMIQQMKTHFERQGIEFEDIL